MRRRTKITASAAVAVVGAIGAQVAVGVTPASAHTVTGYWGDDEDTLGQYSVSVGNVVGAWQHIQYSSGGSGSNVDGFYGPNTATYTALWDWWAGVNPYNDTVENDNSYGHQSWSKAGLFLVPAGTGLGFSYYMFPGVAGRVYTDFGMSWSTQQWKWRGVCASNSWNPMDHGTVTFRRSC